MNELPENLRRYVAALAASGLSIYDSIEVGHPTLWIPTPELQAILDIRLKSLSLQGLPLRTRSKVVKQQVCNALGYPIPSSFTKTQPRFPGQRLDTYAQKSNNLQVWNEELEPNRRYVLLRVSENDEIKSVKVITGEDLALLDTTGTLTQKYQACLIPGETDAELITATDTDRLADLTQPNLAHLPAGLIPIAHPDIAHLLPIASIFERLRSLVGATFENRGYDQERNRGAELHKLICQKLGYATYQDNGRFPDIRNQLFEVKLQTSPTIDLGLVTPGSTEPLDVPQLARRQVRHCDVRYALFYAETDGRRVRLTHFFLTTGQGFFSRFPQFQGRILNKKLQISLPSEFFDR